MQVARRVVALACWVSVAGCSTAVNAPLPRDIDHVPRPEPEDDGCRSQCELAADGCVERPRASFGDLDFGRETFEARCAAGARWAFEAECKDGIVVLRSGTGYTTEGRFYDPDSGEFLGLTTTTDVQSPPCDGKSYWPERVPCAAPVVTDVLCGDTFAEGDPAGRGVTQ